MPQLEEIGTEEHHPMLSLLWHCLEEEDTWGLAKAVSLQIRPGNSVSCSSWPPRGCTL